MELNRAPFFSNLWSIMELQGQSISLLSDLDCCNTSYISEQKKSCAAHPKAPKNHALGRGLHNPFQTNVWNELQLTVLNNNCLSSEIIPAKNYVLLSVLALQCEQKLSFSRTKCLVVFNSKVERKFSGCFAGFQLISSAKIHFCVNCRQKFWKQVQQKEKPCWNLLKRIDAQQ